MSLSSFFKTLLGNKKWLFPIIAGIGIGIAILYISTSTPPPPIAKPAITPVNIPFTHYIGGSGITEPNSGNIEIGTNMPGIVKTMYVEVGHMVKKGDPLFLIEDEEAKADVEQAKASLNQARAILDNARTQYAIIERIQDKRAVSQNEQQEKFYTLQAAMAAVSAAEALLLSKQTALDLHTVRAPIDGSVMSKDLYVGEYAAAGPLSVPLMRLGNLDPLYVRIDIDENDAWRFSEGGKALAFVRGNPELHFNLTFVRTEPYVRPKQSLTGSSTERVDTRVLQVIYAFDPASKDNKEKKVYSGQQMDIYIEALPYPSSPTHISLETK